jgi:hypothetical protein
MFGNGGAAGAPRPQTDFRPVRMEFKSEFAARPPGADDDLLRLRSGLAADYDTLGDCRDALQHGSDELVLRQRLQGPDHRQTPTARAVRLSPIPSRQSVRRP